MSHYPSTSETVDARSALTGARYPDTATLAAFRRSIPHAFDEGCNLDCDDWQHDFAWSAEREHGIGWSERSMFGAPAWPDIARREASAMRSRAYLGGVRLTASTIERQQGSPVAWSDFWDDEQPRSPLPIAYRNPIAQA